MTKFTTSNLRMQQFPLITIITATYNSGQTLQETIDSIGHQTYKNIEYIIIDGKSKDGTVEIIKENEFVVTAWLSEPDTGVYDAWNKGLKLANGSWIAFVGSDDVLYPDAMQDYVDFINNYGDQFSYISSRAHIINQKKEILRTLGWAWEWSTSSRQCNIAHPGSLHSVNLFKRYGNYNTEYKICGDYELLMRGGEKMTAAFIDKVTIRMMIGGLSDSYKVYIESYKVIKKNPYTRFSDAIYGFTIGYGKYLIRRFLRKLGINIAYHK